MQPEDIIRIRHMIEAAETVHGFIEGRKRADLETDRMLLFALVRAIAIIGEAAARVSAETRAAQGTVPWHQIVSMRNRLVHAYFSIDPVLVWKTASDEVPELLVALRKILAGQGG